MPKWRVRNFILLTFLIVITDPYKFLDYDAINVYEIENNRTYSIKVYEPEKDQFEHEREREEQERRLERKLKAILSRTYSPYVFDSYGQLYKPE